MKKFYLQLFSKAYSWSAKHEFDKLPSLYSAVLYICGLQLLNLLSVLFLIESAGFVAANIPKLMAVAVPIALFLFNWAWATRNNASILANAHSQSGLHPGHQKRFVNAYVVITIVIFFAVMVLYVYTAPNPVTE